MKLLGYDAARKSCAALLAQQGLYPRLPGDDVDEAEVQAALAKADAIHKAAQQLLPELTLFMDQG